MEDLDLVELFISSYFCYYTARRDFDSRTVKRPQEFFLRYHMSGQLYIPGQVLCLYNIIQKEKHE